MRSRCSVSISMGVNRSLAAMKSDVDDDCRRVRSDISMRMSDEIQPSMSPLPRDLMNPSRRSISTTGAPRLRVPTTFERVGGRARRLPFNAAPPYPGGASFCPRTAGASVGAMDCAGPLEPCLPLPKTANNTTAPAANAPSHSSTRDELPLVPLSPLPLTVTGDDLSSDVLWRWRSAFAATGAPEPVGPGDREPARRSADAEFAAVARTSPDAPSTTELTSDTSDASPENPLLWGDSPPLPVSDATRVPRDPSHVAERNAAALTKEAGINAEAHHRSLFFADPTL